MSIVRTTSTTHDEMGQGMARLGRPNVTLTRVKGAEHCIRREQPEQFYSIVDDWWQRH